MLSQQPKFDIGVTVKEAILNELEDLIEAQKRYDELSQMGV